MLRARPPTRMRMARKASSGRAAAGVDSVEHCYFIDREGIDMMLARSTVLVATSAAVRNVVSYGVAAGIPRHIAEKAEMRDRCARVRIQGGS